MQWQSVSSLRSFIFLTKTPRNDLDIQTVPEGANFLLFSREGNVNCLRSSVNGNWMYIRHCCGRKRHVSSVFNLTHVQSIKQHV